MKRLFALLPLLSTSVAFAQDLGLAKLLPNGSVRAESSSGRVLATHRHKEGFIPASTLKIATSFCVLERFGRDYRFQTDIFGGPGEHTLYLVGSGDPGLVSEELQKFADEIARHVRTVDRIVIDGRYFAPSIVIDGASRSLNPYDSRNAAFVGNFSTAELSRSRSGAVVSAEPQTPLTPLSRAAGTKLPKGTTERINLGMDPELGSRYGGELLAEFLKRSGVTGAMKVELGPVPSGTKKLMTFKSSKRMEDVARGLLEFSTNFTANQLFLHLGAQTYGAPATVEKGQRAVAECLKSKAGLSDFHVEEGSGLSRKNRLSAEQFMKLLTAFEKYKDLLKEDRGFRAKTGSLTGVNALAGYFTSARHGQVRFSILVNSNVPFTHRFKVAQALRDALD